MGKRSKSGKKKISSSQPLKMADLSLFIGFGEFFLPLASIYVYPKKIEIDALWTCFL